LEYLVRYNNTKKMRLQMLWMNLNLYEQMR
jgi:hypothetical protein